MVVSNHRGYVYKIKAFDITTNRNIRIYAKDPVHQMDIASEFNENGYFVTGYYWSKAYQRFMVNLDEDTFDLFKHNTIQTESQEENEENLDKENERPKYPF